VAFRLTPRDSAFYEMFADAGRNVAAAADLLAGLMDPNAVRATIAKDLRECEHVGDTATHRILRQLNTSFVTPFDREDIYRLAAALDDVVDAMEAAADFVVLTGLGTLPLLMGDQITLLRRSSAETAEAMTRLRTMRDLEPYWIEVNRLENEADRVYRKLLTKLFSGDYDALETLKLRQVADLFEEAADALEHVAHAVETIAVKES
jgi:predicted phosphate transport protein (TIGR00153 family)